jgi:(p)ppGpp synthase/HD superfamily hydrolase
VGPRLARDSERQAETHLDRRPRLPRHRSAGGLEHDRVARQIAGQYHDEKAHEGQKRLSGDKFVSHCVEVAKILVDPRDPSLL